MLALRVPLYVLTIASAFFFGFYERKLRHQLTDETLDQQPDTISDYDSLYNIRKEIRRERILKSLPREVLFKYRVVASLKILFVAILVLEVILLQK